MGIGGGAPPLPAGGAAADRLGFFLGGGGGGFFFPASPASPDDPVDPVGDGDGTGDAALIAACFCAHVVAVAVAAVVTSLGGVGGPVEDPVFEVPSLAKRFCSSLSCDGGVAFGLGGFGGGVSSSAWLGEEDPMPKAGTLMPAAPNLLTAPWFRLLELTPSVDRGLAVRSGVPEPDRGGNLGGRLGALVSLGAAPTTESYEGGLRLPAASLLTGGGGR